MTTAILSRVYRLTTAESENPLRTDTVEGDFETLPRPGFPFTFFAAPLTPGMDIRVVQTSPVVLVTANSSCTKVGFQTENSSYLLTFTQDLTPQMLIELRGGITSGS